MREGVGVAVEADERELGEPLEERLGVAAHAEGGVDEHGAGRSRAGASSSIVRSSMTGVWMRSIVHECPGSGLGSRSPSVAT